MENKDMNKEVREEESRIKDMNILTKRPSDMPFEDYKNFRKIQDKVLKHYLKGKLVWLSKLEPTPGIMKYLAENKMLDTMGKLMHKGETFIGKAKELK